MMYVHAEKCLAYLANPRTASRATAAALQKIGFEMVGSHHSGFGTEGRGSISAFTTVRDEAEMVASWARHLNCTLEEVAEILPRQRHIIDGWTTGLFPHLRHADIVLNYRSLDDDLNDLLVRRGLPPVVLERIG
jgi:hypothetical protein